MEILIVSYSSLSLLIGYCLANKRCKRDNSYTFKQFFRKMHKTNKLHLILELIVNVVFWQLILPIVIIKQVFINDWN